MTDKNEFPRRARLDQMTKAELAIYDAMKEVENMPADTRLTDAVILLQKARERVADFVDNVGNEEPYIFWVCENLNEGEPQYWTGNTEHFIHDDPQGDFWTKDIHKACNFKTQQEAQEQIDYYGMVCEAREHQIG